MAMALAVLFLASCNSISADSDFISDGLGMRSGSPFTPRICVGLKCLAKQSYSAKFEVYFGSDEVFSEDWNSGRFFEDRESCEKENMRFALKRTVRADSKSVSSEIAYKVIDDFPNSEKYLFDATGVDGVMDAYIPAFNYSLEDNFDFSELDWQVKSGSVGYAMVGYDISQNCEVDLNLDTGTASVNYALADADSVVFS